MIASILRYYFTTGLVTVVDFVWISRLCRAELLLSDHRPVCAYFKIEVKKTDKEKERQIRKQIISGKVANGADSMKFSGLSRIHLSFLSERYYFVGRFFSGSGTLQCAITCSIIARL